MTQSSSWGNPYARLSQPPIVDNQPKALEKPAFTEFTYEGWTIVFLEKEPFTWYVRHNCNLPPREEGKTSSRSGYEDNFSRALHYDRVNEEQPEVPGEYTQITCKTCNERLQSYTLLILRRTQKFMLVGKRTREEVYGK